MPDEPRLTSLSHGGGCGCKIAPGLLAELLRGTAGLPVPAQLLVGTETSDDAAVYQVSDDLAIIATTDFFMPIVDDPHAFGQIAATNAISDIYAMGGTPIMALALVAMPISVLSGETIGKVLAGGAAACAAAGIPIAGGHSIDSVEPIYGLAVIGTAPVARVRRNDAARTGDVLVLGKPLGVGICSAALKRETLPPELYEAMLGATTLLNKAGPDLAGLDRVHAMTDVTGFGLAGHALEMARGSGCDIQVDWGKVPLIPGVADLAASGFVTGASARNWTSYGAEVTLAETMGDTGRALLTDPQTSGGLLVSCAPEAAAEVLSTFARHGCGDAAIIGSIGHASANPRLFVA